MDLLPESLYEDIIKGNSVLFAGAGISTEGSRYSSPTFYEIIKSKCNYPKTNEDSFPKVMQHFCDEIDGGYKSRLIHEIIKHIEFFTESYTTLNETTLFHQLVAEIPYFSTIVTTNWDPFFERELNILVPMVQNRDMVYWDDSDKKLLKIHGCVTRPHTIIATQQDYESCIDTNPLIWNKLKDLMATRTFVFTGYSLNDSDFRIIFEEIDKHLGKFKKLAYAFDPYIDEESIEFWKNNGVKVIKADAKSFIKSLKDKLISEGHIIDEDYIEYLKKQRKRIFDIHFDSSRPDDDEQFASNMYQDGLMHGIDAVLDGDLKGKTDQYILNQVKHYNKAVKKCLEHENLIDVAYYNGWRSVFMHLLHKKNEDIPAFFNIENLKPVQELRNT